MTLCMGIIEDALGQPVLYKNFLNTDNPFMLEHCEIYDGGPVLNTGVLYLAQSDLLPENIAAQDGSALICIGMPSKTYTKKTAAAIGSRQRYEPEDAVQ